MNHCVSVKSSMHLKEKVNLRTDLGVDHLFIFCYTHGLLMISIRL